MKKLLASAVLALVVSGVMTAQSFAGCCFGLFTHHGCCGCCGCGAQFCVRQYNAFSPVCCGTVFCDGCLPFGSGCGNGGGPGMCGPGGCGLQFSGVLPQGCGAGGCGGGDGAYLGSLPPGDGYPVAPGAGVPLAPGGVPVQAAPGTPLPVGPTSQIVNDRPIQNASYRPASYTQPSTVAPVRVQPQMMAAPSYWGN